MWSWGLTYNTVIANFLSVFGAVVLISHYGVHSGNYEPFWSALERPLFCSLWIHLLDLWDGKSYVLFCFHAPSFMVLCRENSIKRLFKFVVLKILSWGLTSKYSCPQHTALPCYGHWNVVRRSRKLWKIVLWCLKFFGVGVGSSGGRQWHASPFPCNAFSTSHASWRMQELTDVITTVFKLEKFYFLKLLQKELPGFHKTYISLFVQMLCAFENFISVV